MKRFSDIKEIVYKDSYLIRRYREDDFDCIVDIGANTGTFTLVSHIFFPKAQVFSYEPCIPSYNIMKENLYGFSNINIFNKALGDGSYLYFESCGGSEICTGNRFVKNDNGNYKIKSDELCNIFINNNIDLNNNILLKIDCEGGEKSLLSNNSNYYLKKCRQISMEIHFQCSNNRDFDKLPRWEEYNSWVYEVFEKSHDILYHRSNKNKGVGVYVLVRKEL